MVASCIIHVVTHIANISKQVGNGAHNSPMPAKAGGRYLKKEIKRSFRLIIE